jgi:hypothetical protein
MGSGKEQEGGTTRSGFFLRLSSSGNLLHARAVRMGLCPNGGIVIAPTPGIEREIIGLGTAAAEDREIGIRTGLDGITRNKGIVPWVPLEGTKGMLVGVDAH